MNILGAAAAVLLFPATAALAEAVPADEAQTVITLDGGSAERGSTVERTRSDPNQIVCKRNNDPSSRLSRKRVCMTRAQYEERRMLDRDAVERGQANRQTR